MKVRLTVVASVFAIAGCASLQQPDDVVAAIARQISASTAAEEGVVRAHAVSSWYPNTRGYDFANDLQREVNGAIAITASNLLVKTWGGEHGLKDVYSIPLSSIAQAYVARHGLSTRLVVGHKSGRFDSFAVKDPAALVKVLKSE